MTFSSIPSAKPAGPPPKPPITWTIPHLPGAQMNQWHDGSVKITFPPEQAEQVIAHFEQVVKAMNIGHDMIKNPPKKCPKCRGQGQVIVKTGDARETHVCDGCNGSGMKIHRPTDPSKLMTRNFGHTPPLEPLLPHQTHVPEQIRNEQPKPPEPQPGLREIDASALSSEFED